VPKNAAACRRTSRSLVVMMNGEGGASRSEEDLAGLGGDFGARDATAGEIESQFNSKSLGEADTEHIVQVPRGVAEFTALAKRDCAALVEGDVLVEEVQKLVYAKQVMDWKIRVVDGHEVLRREWSTGGDKDKAAEVVTRLTTIAECEGQTVESFIEGPGVRVELFTRALNGLHLNDFIMAAKMDKLDLTDVTIKKKPNIYLV